MCSQIFPIVFVVLSLIGLLISSLGGRGRGGFQPGRPSASKKEPLKFDNDYDFEQANDEFAEMLSKLGVRNYVPLLDYRFNHPFFTS